MLLLALVLVLTQKQWPVEPIAPQQPQKVHLRPGHLPVARHWRLRWRWQAQRAEQSMILRAVSCMC